MTILSKRTIVTLLVSASSISSGEGFLTDIRDWFLNLFEKSPKIVVDCVLNDIEQFLDVAESLTLGKCGFQAFANSFTDPPPGSSLPFELVGSDSDKEVFVFDTPVESFIRSSIKCIDTNIKDITFSAKVLRTASRGIRLSNVASYVAVCLLEEVSGGACFSADTTACRIDDKLVSPEEAYKECLNNEHAEELAKEGAAHRVLMSHLLPGDMVLSKTANGELFFDKVFVNFHRKQDDKKAPLLKIHHSGMGTISVTPDHMLFVDGMFQPASNAIAGSKLSDGLVVTKVDEKKSLGSIINPITFGGTILAAGNDAPILSTTVSDSWIGRLFLTSAYKTYSPCQWLARLFPFYVQSYYETVLGPFLDQRSTFLYESPLNYSVLSTALVILCDLLVATGYIMYVCCVDRIVFGLLFLLFFLVVASPFYQERKNKKKDA